MSRHTVLMNDVAQYVAPTAEYVRDNVAQVLFFRDTQRPQTDAASELLCLANTHIFWEYANCCSCGGGGVGW